MPSELNRAVPFPKKHEMIELQKRFEPCAAEQIDVMRNNLIEKFIRCEHIPSHCRTKIITAGIEHCIYGWKVPLHIAQLIVDALKMQA